VHRAGPAGSSSDGLLTDIDGRYSALKVTRVGAENVMAEYCMRGLNDTIPPSHTGTETEPARGRPAR
jgi:hypothetical protein